MPTGITFCTLIVFQTLHSHIHKPKYPSTMAHNINLWLLKSFIIQWNHDVMTLVFVDNRIITDLLIFTSCCYIFRPLLRFNAVRLFNFDWRYVFVNDATYQFSCFKLVDWALDYNIGAKFKASQLLLLLRLWCTVYGNN